MNEKDLMNDLMEVDKFLAKVVNPALRRDEHDAIRSLMQIVGKRVEMSFKLEAELKKLQEANKDDKVD